MTAALFLLALLVICVSSQDNTSLGCLCYEEGAFYGYAGATVINTSCDLGCNAAACSQQFGPYNYLTFGCHSVDNDTWAGDYQLDPCSACLLDKNENGTLGVCVNCCSEDDCDCVHDDVTFVENDNGTLTVTITTTHAGTRTLIFNHTGDAGYTATGNVTEIYDVQKDGDSLTFLNRRSSLCNFSATRNPSTTSWLKLALIIGGVAIGAILLLLYFCCNPFKKCRKNAKTEKTVEGETPYRPLSNGDAAGINYTGPNNL